MDFPTKNPDRQAKQVVGFEVFIFFNLDFRWLLGVDLVGFVLNCWINARICGLIVTGLCLYLVVVDLGFVLQTLENLFTVNVLQI